jgi:acetoin utilization deacetylase AcuC-like enzyme
MILRDEFLEHDTGLHPEKKERLTAIRDKIERTSYFSRLLRPEPRIARREEIATIHSPNYMEDLEEICRKKRSGFLDPDTPFSEGTYQAACLAAGSGLTLADLVLSGKAKNGMALVRPPGHHAIRESAMGFCFFNSIAVTANYLKSKGLKRIMIIDWDVHHGNGTESAFYEEEEVFFVSLHQFPFYPGTGRKEDRGRGKGLGKNLNCPLPRGSRESDYQREWESEIFPALDEFGPEFILISAGFDAHKSDPLGGMELESRSFENFTTQVMKKAKEHCGGRVISFLEGGYDLSALAESVELHLGVLDGS